MINQQFSEKLNQISQDVGMDPRDLLLCMYLESGVDSTQVNHVSGQAKGLIQFMPDTLRGLGVPEHQINTFNKVPALEQLDYVKKYIQSKMSYAGRSFKSASEYYVANFWPVALKKWHGQDPIANKDVVVVDRRSSNGHERNAYEENAGLDVNKDGKITVGDITLYLLKVYKSTGYQKMLDNFNRMVGSDSSPQTNTNRPMQNLTRTPTSQQPKENGMLSGFLSKIEKFLEGIFAGQLSEEKMKKYAGLPNNKFLITVDSKSKLEDKLEYVRVLSLALREELDAGIKVCCEKNQIEIECNVFGNEELASESVKEICYAISDEFLDATYKLGGIKINNLIRSEEHTSEL